MHVPVVGSNQLWKEPRTTVDEGESIQTLARKEIFTVLQPVLARNVIANATPSVDALLIYRSRLAVLRVKSFGHLCHRLVLWTLTSGYRTYRLRAVTYNAR